MLKAYSLLGLSIGLITVGCVALVYDQNTLTVLLSAGSIGTTCKACKEIRRAQTYKS